jgi:hypothetical protein
MHRSGTAFQISDQRLSHQWHQGQVFHGLTFAAADADRVLRPVQIIQAQPSNFTGPESAVSQKHQDGVIPATRQRAAIYQTQRTFHFAPVDRSRQRSQTVQPWPRHLFGKIPIQEPPHVEVSQEPTQSRAYRVHRLAAEVASLLNEKTIHLGYRDAPQRTGIAIKIATIEKVSQMTPLTFDRLLADSTMVAEEAKVLGEYRWI